LPVKITGEDNAMVTQGTKRFGVFE